MWRLTAPPPPPQAGFFLHGNVRKSFFFFLEKKKESHRSYSWLCSGTEEMCGQEMRKWGEILEVAAFFKRNRNCLCLSNHIMIMTFARDQGTLKHLEFPTTQLRNPNSFSNAHVKPLWERCDASWRTDTNEMARGKKKSMLKFKIIQQANLPQKGFCICVMIIWDLI